MTRINIAGENQANTLKKVNYFKKKSNQREDGKQGQKYHLRKLQAALAIRGLVIYGF